MYLITEPKKANLISLESRAWRPDSCRLLSRARTPDLMFLITEPKEASLIWWWSRAWRPDPCWLLSRARTPDLMFLLTKPKEAILIWWWSRAWRPDPCWLLSRARTPDLIFLLLLEGITGTVRRSRAQVFSGFLIFPFVFPVSVSSRRIDRRVINFLVQADLGHLPPVVETGPGFLA